MRINHDLSICCIILTYNEERCIERCLKSVTQLFDDVIVIDTGSKDNTLNIISNYESDIKLYNYVWRDSFAEARNFGISKCTSDIIFFVDADEFFEKNMTYEVLHNKISSVKKRLFNRTVISPMIYDVGTNQVHKDIPRIFLNCGELKYYGDVHEEIRCKKQIVKYENIDLVMFHDGYIEEVLHKKKKMERNIRYLENMRNKEPNNLRWIYFYVRDGMKIIKLEKLIDLIKDNIFLDAKNNIIKDNLVSDKYTFRILQLLCKLYILRGEYTSAIGLAKQMNSLFGTNIDTLYFSYLATFLNLKKTLNDLYVEIVSYRKNNHDEINSKISSEGYHIDLLIAFLLYEKGDYKNSEKFLKYLENKFNDELTVKLINFYLNKINNYNCK